MNKGKIVQVMGPVVDVVFEDGQLPDIKDALEVENNGKRCVMEVSQHLGNNIVRCIMLGASEGLQRDREVTATGSGIKVPVGDKTLGRLFNVLGDTVDGGDSLTVKSIGSSIVIRLHLKSRNRQLRSWKQVSRLSTFLLHMQKVVRSVCSVVPVLVRQSLSRS